MSSSATDAVPCNAIPLRPVPRHRHLTHPDHDLVVITSLPGGPRGRGEDGDVAAAGVTSSASAPASDATATSGGGSRGEEGLGVVSSSSIHIIPFVSIPTGSLPPHDTISALISTSNPMIASITSSPQPLVNPSSRSSGLPRGDVLISVGTFGIGGGVLSLVSFLDDMLGTEY